MSDMVERVAAIIAQGVGDDASSEAVARAVLKEMRDPTKRMTDAGIVSNQRVLHNCVGIWQEMIDAALYLPVVNPQRGTDALRAIS